MVVVHRSLTVFLFETFRQAVPLVIRSETLKRPLYKINRWSFGAERLVCSLHSGCACSLLQPLARLVSDQVLDGTRQVKVAFFTSNRASV